MLMQPEGAPGDGLDAYLIVIYRSFAADIRAALGGQLEPADDWVRLVWRRPDSTPQAATCRAVVLARRGALIEERAVARFPGAGAIMARLVARESFVAGTLHAKCNLIAAATLVEPRAMATDRASLPALADDVAVLRSQVGRVNLVLPAPHPWQKLLPTLREPRSGLFLLTRRAGGGLPGDRPTPPFSPGQLM